GGRLPQNQEANGVAGSTGNVEGADPPEAQHADSRRRSGAVTAAGVAFLLLALLYAAKILMLLWRPIAIQNPAATFYYSTVGASLLMAVVTAFAGVTTVLRRRGWRAWAGTVSWLTLIFAGITVGPTIGLFELPSPIGSTRPTLPLLMGVLPSLFMVLVSIFALWARRKEERSATDVRSGEVTAAGVVLLLIGIGFGVGAAAAVYGFSVRGTPGVFGMF